MAKLVDMGRFTWTTPVSEVLPGFSLADTNVTSRLEMRHTVSACTGMPRRDVDLLFRFQGIRPEDRIAEMKAMLPTTGFGETFQYSNYLVAAGGYAAAHSFVPGTPLAEAYETAMRQLVFEPLRMSQTAVLHNDSAEDASPHGFGLNGDSVPIDPTIEQFADAVAPAGSVWSTVLDMLSYVRCELRNGTNDDGEQVVSVENLMARRQPAIKIDGKNSYGLGLILTEQQGIEEITHSGNTLGFTSDMLFLPKHGIGMCGSHKSACGQFFPACGSSAPARTPLRRPQQGRRNGSGSFIFSAENSGENPGACKDHPHRNRLDREVCWSVSL